MLEKLKRFKKKINKEKKQPKSKGESFLYGFGAVLAIFGVTFFSSSLPANAKDLVPRSPRNSPPGGAQPAPGAERPSEEIIRTLTGAAATLCGLAVSSGSFMVGAVCGVVVAVGILKAQGK